MEFDVNGLFTRALDEKDYRYIMSIPVELYNDTEKVWYNYIATFTKQYKSFVPFELFTKDNPAFRINRISTDIPTKYIFDQLIPYLQQLFITKQMMLDASQNKKILNAQYLEELARKVTPTPTDVLEFTSLKQEDFVENTKIIKLGKDAQWFNELIGGEIASNDFGLISGRAKSAKTTVLSLLAVSLFKQGYNVMIFNNELGKKFFAQKIVAILQKFNPHSFREETINDEVRGKLLEFENSMTNYSNEMYLYGRIRSFSDVISAYNRTKKKPDILLIDAINNAGTRTSNMSDQTVSIQSFIIELRDFINEYNVPVIATSQLNRAAANADTPGQETLAGSDEFVRQVDWLTTTTYKEHDVDKITNPIAQKYIEKYKNGKMPFYDMHCMVNRHGDAGGRILMHLDWQRMAMLYTNQSIQIKDDLTEKDFFLGDKEND